MKASELREALKLVNEVFPSPEPNKYPSFILQGDKVVLVIWFISNMAVRWRPIEFDKVDTINKRQLLNVKKQHEQLLARGI